MLENAHTIFFLTCDGVGFHRQQLFSPVGVGDPDCASARIPAVPLARTSNPQFCLHPNQMTPLPRVGAGDRVLELGFVMKATM